MDKETVKQAMEATVTLLGQIPVPVALSETIAYPIALAINNMKIGLEALEAEEKPEVTEDGNTDTD